MGAALTGRFSEGRRLRCCSAVSGPVEFLTAHDGFILT